ncbi:MAG TPA: hypothetical protein ENG48_11210 [Candidatus Atribacteria bacterium]|nr:hypothetical protein [Candidatus Atribacteria bacterium]
MDVFGKSINWVTVVIAILTMLSSIAFMSAYQPQPTVVKEVVVKDMQQDMKIVMIFKNTEKEVKQVVQKEYPKYIIFDMRKAEKYYIVTLIKEVDLHGNRN